VTRTQTTLATASYEASSTPFDDVRALTRKVVSSSGPERVRWAGDLNAALRALPTRAPAEEVSRHLVEALDQKTWEGLQDAEGWTCRAIAVQTLVGLGYPWALWVDPEDLAHLRQNPILHPSVSTRPLAKLKWALPVFGLIAAGIVGEHLHTEVPLEAATPVGVLPASSAGLALLSKSRTRRRIGSALTALLGGGFVYLYYSPFSAGLALGLASITAAFVAAIADSTVRRLD